MTEIRHASAKPLQQLSSMIVNEHKQTEKLTNFCRAICFLVSIFYCYSHLLVDAVFLEASYSLLGVREAVLSFELETVDFTFARYRSKITELDFRFRHRYATVHIQRVTCW